PSMIWKPPHSSAARPMSKSTRTRTSFARAMDRSMSSSVLMRLPDARRIGSTPRPGGNGSRCSACTVRRRRSTQRLGGCRTSKSPLRSQSMALPGLQTVNAHDYAFLLGFPNDETTQKAYDDADLNRAIEAYRFFYPTVSGAAIVRGNEDIGVIPNKIFGYIN